MTGKYNERNKIEKFVITFQFYELNSYTYQSTSHLPLLRKILEGVPSCRLETFCCPPT